MSFDYRSTPVGAPRGAVIGLFVVGAILAVACGAWVATPFIAAANDRTTTGVISGWHEVYTGRSADYSPSIDYTVDGKDYSLTSTFEVEVDVERAKPAGTNTTVQYDPNNPGAAEWVPAASDIAVNFWGVTGLCLGLILVVAGLMGRALNSRARKAEQ